MLKEVEAKIIGLNHRGFSNQEITLKLGLKKHTVKNVNKKLGLKSNVEGAYFAVSETHGLCWSCKNELEKSNFEVHVLLNKNGEEFEWIDGRCKDCRYKKKRRKTTIKIKRRFKLLFKSKVYIL